MADEKWWIFHQGFFLPRERKNRGKYFSLFSLSFSSRIGPSGSIKLDARKSTSFLVKSNIDSLFSGQDWNRKMNVVTALTLIWSLSAKNFRLMNFKGRKKRWRVIKKSRNNKFTFPSVFFKRISWIFELIDTWPGHN